jgi:hypothetical protein
MPPDVHLRAWVRAVWEVLGIAQQSEYMLHLRSNLAWQKDHVGAWTPVVRRSAEAYCGMMSISFDSSS